jgi:thiamine pyrophosphokinase
MSTFLILLGGNLTVTDRLKAQITGARVIAADGGMRHATGLGVTPELWVGDFDSAPQELIGEWADVERQTFPSSKALTDGELAVEAALARGATKLVLAGALGGERSDHAMAHMVLVTAMKQAGHTIMLTSGDEEAWPIAHGTQEIDLPPGSLFSVLGFSALTGLTIANARYPLADFDLAFGSSRTISNVAEGRIGISLEGGSAILLARPYDLTGI